MRDRLKTTLFASLVCCLLASPSSAWSAEGLPDVSEGDWVVGPVKVLASDLWLVGERPVRVWGIDGVDLKQACRDDRGDSYDCGRSISARLAEMLNGEIGECLVRSVAKRNKVQLVIGQCRAGNIDDFGRFAVVSGFARPMRAELARTPYLETYAADHDFAHESKRGLYSGYWSSPWSDRSSRGRMRDDSIGSLQRLMQP